MAGMIVPVSIVTTGHRVATTVSIGATTGQASNATTTTIVRALAARADQTGPRVEAPGVATPGVATRVSTATAIANVLDSIGMRTGAMIVRRVAAMTGPVFHAIRTVSALRSAVMAIPGVRGLATPAAVIPVSTRRIAVPTVLNLTATTTEALTGPVSIGKAVLTGPGVETPAVATRVRHVAANGPGSPVRVLMTPATTTGGVAGQRKAMSGSPANSGRSRANGAPANTIKRLITSAKRPA